MTIFIYIIIVCKLLASQPEREWRLENKKRNLLPELVVYTLDLTWSFSSASD